MESESFVPLLPQVVIYEANLRALGPKVGFNTLRSRLKSIKSMGVNGIWLMPIQPVGKLRSVGQLGSPYSLADYDTVNPEFGTSSDLKALIKGAHQMKMAIILDWVADHTAWDHPWIKAHPDWYLHTPSGEISIPTGTGWNDVAGLDYNQQPMQEAMIASMKRWVTDYDVDGFRCDAADRMPVTFWTSAIKALRAATPRRLLMLSEGFFPANYPEGFDLTYGWNFNTKIREIIGGKPATELAGAVAYEQKDIPSNARRLRFTTNHDMSAWEGSEIELYKTKEAAQMAFAVSALYNGNPLIYTGQEVDWDKRIPIFEQSTIDWTQETEKTGWIAHLITLRSHHPALLTGIVEDTSTKDAIIFSRTEGSDQGLVIANVRNQPVTVSLPTQIQGIWGKTTLTDELTLQPYQYQIYFRKGASS